MTQQEFLRRLKRLLRHAPEAERNEALRYYREYLQDAGLQPGQDVTPLVGTPEQAARGVMADAQIRQNQAQAQMHRRMEIGRIVLAIVLFLPMVIALALLVAFGMTGLGLVLGGIAALGTIFFAGSLAQGLIVAGYALLMFSVGGLLVIAVLVLVRLLWRGLRTLLKGKGDAHV